MCGEPQNASQIFRDSPAPLSLLPQQSKSIETQENCLASLRSAPDSRAVFFGASSVDGPVHNVVETVLPSGHIENIYGHEDKDWTPEVSEAGGPPTTLLGAIRIALLVNHSFLPVFGKGDVRKRAALRTTSALAAAVSACVVVRAVSSNTFVCVSAIAGIAWCAIEIEGFLQYIVRRRMLARSIVSNFDPSDMLDMTDVEITDVDMNANLNDFGELASIAEKREVLSNCNVPRLAPDVVGERLLEEYGRLAPTTCEATTASAHMEAIKTDDLTKPAIEHAPEVSDRIRHNSKRGLRGPMAKVPGDIVVRPPSSTGASSFSGAASSAKDTKKSGTLSISTHTRSMATTTSVLSVNGPTMQLTRNCDIDELRARYIQSITANRQNVEVDRRLDCDDIMLMDDAWIIAASDWSTPCLSLSCTILVVAMLVCVGLCIGLSRQFDCTNCLDQIVWQASAGWFIAIFVCNLIGVLVNSAMKFRLFQGHLAARRDQQWKTLAMRRNQKSEAMRAVASSSSTAVGSTAPAESATDKFDKHLAVFLSGRDMR